VIAELNPRARLLLSLRDPVDRHGGAFSTEFTLGDAIDGFPRMLAGSSCMRVTNGIHLGCSLPLTK
jgi:hypothetical protein